MPPDVPLSCWLLPEARHDRDLAPHLPKLSAGLVFLTAISVNFIGDGLRDALDPRRWQG